MMIGHLIAESDELRLEHKYEYTFLIKKSNNKILLEDDFYGEPYCGLIDEKSKWAIVAGEHMTVWMPMFVRHYQTDQFKWIHSLRIKDANTIEILVDPRSKISAIWEFDLKTKSLKKIKDFNKYRYIEYTEEEYCEDIEW